MERNLALLPLPARTWQSAHPGLGFPGLCANVHPLTGKLRPTPSKRLWGGATVAHCRRGAPFSPRAGCRRDESCYTRSGSRPSTFGGAGRVRGDPVQDCGERRHSMAADPFTATLPRPRRRPSGKQERCRRRRPNFTSLFAGGGSSSRAVARGQGGVAGAPDAREQLPGSRRARPFRTGTHDHGRVLVDASDDR